jgi:hypothetical protein
MTSMIDRALRPLFTVDLQYKQGLPPITSADGRIGQYLGSGEGTVSGDRLMGTVRWDLYEVVGETRCETNFAGIIKTSDEAQIQFEAKGYGMVRDSEKPNTWTMVAALQFDTSDRAYAWLNNTIAVWDGEFDMESDRHHYQVYAQSG